MLAATGGLYSTCPWQGKRGPLIALGHWRVICKDMRSCSNPLTTQVNMTLLEPARQVGLVMAASVKSRLACELELAWQHWDTLPYHVLGTFAPFMGARLEDG